VRHRTLPPRARPIVKATDLGSTAVLRHGALTLVADPFGDLHVDGRGLGLYHGDTRILSGLAFLLDGQRPTLLEPDAGGYDQGVIQLTNPELRNDPAVVPEGATLATQSLGIRRERVLDSSGLREHVFITNHTMYRQDVTAAVLLDVDGADIFEVRGYGRPTRGELRPVEVDDATVVFGYAGLDGLELRTTVAFDHPPDAIESPPADREGSVAARWRRAIDPDGVVELGWSVQASWHRLDTGARVTGGVATPPVSAGSPATETAAAEERPAATDGPPTETGPAPRHDRAPVTVERLEARRSPDLDLPEPTRFESDDELVNLMLARGLADVRLLETSGPTPGEAFIAAGVPWFATLFGRDAITTALFMLPVIPGLARTTLEVLARRQAVARDDWRDAEPGKILHELRTGEMARTGELPFSPYYGSADATPLWLLLLDEAHAWTGDDRLVDDLWPHALAALGWLETSAARDGFVQYQRRSERGLINQGWKDSHDSVRDRNGAVAEAPIALLEVQCYTIAAFRGMAAQATRRGEPDLASRLETAAAGLSARMEAAFWVPDLDRYAMALDGHGKQADALASNAGHGLWTGTLDVHRAALVARDLAGPRMASGWGLRSFGAGQPGFNPLGYHLGTVWPHDTAIAVAGLRRYGYDDEAVQLASGLLDAARTFPLFRFPELFCGFDRADTRVPVAYPVACAPQAWAAASPFLLLRALLGITANAPAHELQIERPMLPRTLRSLTVTGLRVGDATVDLLFHRWRGSTSAEVLRRTGDVTVVLRL
jgi:glycogen debranching enzyme